MNTPVSDNQSLGPQSESKHLKAAAGVNGERMAYSTPVIANVSMMLRRLGSVPSQVVKLVSTNCEITALDSRLLGDDGYAFERFYAELHKSYQDSDITLERP